MYLNTCDCDGIQITFKKNADGVSAGEAEAKEQLWSARFCGNMTKDADQSDFLHSKPDVTKKSQCLRNTGL